MIHAELVFPVDKLEWMRITNVYVRSDDELRAALDRLAARNIYERRNECTGQCVEIYISCPQRHARTFERH